MAFEQLTFENIEDRKEKVKSNDVPEILKNMPDTIKGIVDYFGISKIMRYDYSENPKDENGCRILGEKSHEYKYVNQNYSVLKINDKDGCYADLVYVDNDCNVWNCRCYLNFSVTYKYSYDERDTTAYIVKIGKWHKVKKYIFEPSMVQSQKEIEEKLKKVNPYGYKFCKEYSVNIYQYIMAPQIEILMKSNYAFCNNFVQNGCRNNNYVDYFNRLCQRGNNPKEIFKVPKHIYKLLKNECDLKVWDSYRKMDKFGYVSFESLKQIYENSLRTQELDKIYKILSFKWENKSVFTWDGLINYLHRIDMYEAIDMYEGLMLLNDYFSMCRQLKIKPKIDGDSLKREHDVTARLIRQKRNEALDAKMANACREMQKYNYEEDIFIVRGIKNYDDLLDEAKQQHNCVACYGPQIANGNSLIFTMRLKSAPDKSLITIELSPSDLSIRQKYLSYNRPVRNKAQSDFIDRWLKKIRSEKSKAA